MNLTKWTTLLLCMLCSGCGSMLTTEYQRPNINFSSAVTSADAEYDIDAADAGWWSVFADKLLSKIIYETMRNNNDLLSAALRLNKSKLDAGEINTNMFPDFNSSLNANNSRVISRSSKSSESYSASTSMSYEIDLWGKLEKTRRHGELNIDLSEEDLNNTELNIIESVSKSYWSIAKYNQKIELYRQRLDIAKSTFAIIKAKNDYGSGTVADMSLAEKSLLSNELQLRNIISQRDVERNAMATIYNKDGISRPQEKTGLGDFFDIELPLLSPVDVMARRPDIRAAELRIKSALVAYDLAKVNFFPSISLGATISAGSNVFTQWFSEQSLLQSISATIPPLQWKKLHYQLQKEQLSVELSVNDFRNSVLKALNEVANALVTRNKSQYALEAQKKTLSLSQDIMRINMVKYNSGAIAFQELLDSQDDVLNQKILYLDYQYDYLVSTMKFLLSTGGGATSVRGNT